MKSNSSLIGLMNSITYLMRNKFLSIISIFITITIGASCQTIEKNFFGSVADSEIWTHEFYLDGTYKFFTTGTRGNLFLKGNYQVSGDTIFECRNSSCTIKSPYLIQGDTILIDLVTFDKWRLFTLNNGIEKLDTSRIAVIPLNNTMNWSWHLTGNRLTELNIYQIYYIDSILNVCIAENNNHGKGVGMVGRDIGNHTFKKQIVPSINSNNEIVVWVNCFSDDKKSNWDEGANWKKDIIEINDGGASGGLFNVKINLSKRKYYDLYVNGI